MHGSSGADRQIREGITLIQIFPLKGQSLPLPLGEVARVKRVGEGPLSQKSKIFANSPNGGAKGRCPAGIGDGFCVPQVTDCHPCFKRLDATFGGMGISHGLPKCPPDTSVPSLRSGRPFDFRTAKKDTHRRCVSFLVNDGARNTNTMP